MATNLITSDGLIKELAPVVTGGFLSLLGTALAAAVGLMSVHLSQRRDEKKLLNAKREELLRLAYRALEWATFVRSDMLGNGINLKETKPQIDEMSVIATLYLPDLRKAVAGFQAEVLDFHVWALNQRNLPASNSAEDQFRPRLERISARLNDIEDKMRGKV